MSEVTDPVADPVADPAPAPAATAAAAPAAAPAAPAAPVEPEDKGYWAADWRERMAGGDDKALKQLSRYATPEDVWKKARTLEVERSSGKLKPVLGKEATPEDIAEYRKAWGIPEAPDKYDINDLKIDDIDKPFIGEVLKAAHGVNLTPDQAKAVVGIWPQLKAQAAQIEREREVQAQKAAEDELRDAWGADYRRHENLISGFLDRFTTQDVKTALLESRLPDGTKFANSAAMKKFILSLALIENPTATLVPSGSTAAATITSRIKEIETVMRENRTRYNKDEAMQAEYRDLLGRKQKLDAH